jgi:hypothetical protein
VLSVVVQYGIDDRGWFDDTAWKTETKDAVEVYNYMIFGSFDFEMVWVGYDDIGRFAMV